MNYRNKGLSKILNQLYFDEVENFLKLSSTNYFSIGIPQGEGYFISNDICIKEEKLLLKYQQNFNNQQIYEMDLIKRKKQRYIEFKKNIQNISKFNLNFIFYIKQNNNKIIINEQTNIKKFRKNGEFSFNVDVIYNEMSIYNIHLYDFHETDYENKKLYFVRESNGTYRKFSYINNKDLLKNFNFLTKHNIFEPNVLYNILNKINQLNEQKIIIENNLE